MSLLAYEQYLADSSSKRAADVTMNYLKQNEDPAVQLIHDTDKSSACTECRSDYDRDNSCSDSVCPADTESLASDDTALSFHDEAAFQRSGEVKSNKKSSKPSDFTPFNSTRSRQMQMGVPKSKGYVIHTNRPTAAQINFNKELSRMNRAEQILNTVSAAIGNNCNLNATNLSTALHRLVVKGGQRTKNIESDPRLTTLLNSLQTTLEKKGSDFNARELANTAWALAKLKISNSGILFKLIQEECMDRCLFEFNWQDISNMLWGFATVKFHSKDLFHRFSVQVLDRDLDDVCPQVISNIIWSFGTVGHFDDELVEKISTHVLFKGLDEFKPMELSSMIWAMAALGHSDERLFQKVSEFVLSKGLNGFNAPKISIIAWSFARARYPAEDLFSLIEEFIVEKGMSSFNCQNISCIVWAFAVFGRMTDDLMACVEEQIWNVGFAGFSDQSFVDLLWGFATSDLNGTCSHAGEDTVKMAAAYLRKRSIRSFSSRQLSTMAWAFARLGQFHDQAFYSLEQEILRRDLREFDASEMNFISNAFRAYRNSRNLARMCMLSGIGIRLLSRLDAEESSATTVECNTPESVSDCELWPEETEGELFKARMVEKHQMMKDNVLVPRNDGCIPFQAC
eukprot:746239-Hanusia_phi.AAC.14